MRNKIFWLGMIIMVIVMVFGITIVGCDDGSIDGTSGNGTGADWNQFVGVWCNAGSYYYLAFYPDLTVTFSQGSSIQNGFYKYNGNTATVVLRISAFTAILKSDSLLDLSGETYTKM